MYIFSGQRVLSFTRLLREPFYPQGNNNASYYLSKIYYGMNLYWYIITSTSILCFMYEKYAISLIFADKETGDLNS